MRETDTSDILAMERHMLYVAATRARDFLLITGATPISEFLSGLDR